MKKPELLAPVGSWEALVAAVQNGADAVYIGGKHFNARQYANNFEAEELQRAVAYAHVRGVRVYVTVNILVADQEMDSLVQYLQFLYEAGVDAIIVQDLGVARIVKKVLPELTIHASTQMTLHNKPGVELAIKMGFKRVVLAREMSLEEIKEIKQTGIEIEFFVHGALCISYSGQCLMSSMIGGRSGNRGRCAQPCRMEYTLVDEKGNTVWEPEKVGKYLLSPRDLRLLHHIPELTEAGVNALKIEGRMKRPEYVATVTRVYREALDRYAAAPYNYEIGVEEEKQLYQIFNRDFTTGYIKGNLGAEMMSYKRPNNRGIKIGRVANADWKNGFIEVQLEDKLQLGDGIEVWVSEGGRKGAVVHQMYLKGQPVETAQAGQTVAIPLKGKIRTGDRIFKTKDLELIRRAQNTFNSPREFRKIKIAVKVRARVGEPLQVAVEDTEGNKAVVKTDFIGQEAINRPLTKETIRRQVERMGNTPFELGTLEIKLEGNVMVPISEINDARRKALQILEQQRAMLRKPVPIPHVIIEDRLQTANEGMKNIGSSKKMLLSAAVGNVECAREAIKAGADILYVGTEGFSGMGYMTPDDLQNLAGFAADHGTVLAISTPRITKDIDLLSIKKLLEKAYELNLSLMAGNLGALEFASRMGYKEIYADYSLNLFNSHSLLWLKEQGVKAATVSPELTLQQLTKLVSVIPLEVIVQGALPLMVSEHCVLGSIHGCGNAAGRVEGMGNRGPCKKGKMALRDRLGLLFPLVSDRFCRTHVYNPMELCLVEDLKALYEAGITTVRLEVRKDQPRYVEKVTRIYREELDKLHNNIDAYSPSADIKEKLTRLNPQGITKGHLYRGVL